MNRRFTIAMTATVLAGSLLSGGAAIAAPMLAVSPTSHSVSTSPEQADKFTQLSMNITNNTGQTLTLASAEHNGSGDHWQNRAPQTLTDGQSVTVSLYGSGASGANLTYTMPDGQQVYFNGYVSGLGGADNSTSGSGSSDPAYTVTSNIPNGWNVTATYTAQPTN